MRYDLGDRYAFSNSPLYIRYIFDSCDLIDNKPCLSILNHFMSSKTTVVTSSCQVLNEFYDEHEVTIENFRLYLLRD